MAPHSTKGLYGSVLKTGALALASLGLLSACETMNGDMDMDDDMPMASASGQMSMASVQSMVASWPDGSRKAAMAMLQKYGAPDGVTPTMLSWSENGPWKWTRVFRDPVQHDFPIPHPDVLEQAINYEAPIDMYDDLAHYDGSVIVERTKGQMSARCDKEGANFLALNLANDVATGQRSVEDARAYYASAMKTFMQTGQMDPYMQRLMFQTPGEEAGDPDETVIQM